MRRWHERRTFAIIQQLEGEQSVRREFAIPQAARFVDGLVVVREASEAWGPIRQLMSNRLVSVEHFSRTPSVRGLLWAVAKHGWLVATWRDRGKTGNSLRALVGEFEEARLPLLLVLCCGRPLTAVAAAAETGLRQRAA